MERTQIYLTEMERKTLKAMAVRLGRSQSALIREAVDRYIERHEEGNRSELLRQAKGMWAKREDLPDFEDLRRELDRLGDETK